MKNSLFGLLCLPAIVFGDVISYPRPSIYEKSGNYTLKVNGDYQNTTNYFGYDYVHISMSEGQDTEFRISAPTESSITSYNISPEKLTIKATTSGNELVFSVKTAYYLIIKINDLKEFVVYADPLETDIPPSSGTGIFNVLQYGADNTGAGITQGVQSALDAAGKSPGSTVYVPPGLYYVGNLKVPSQTSLYLAGGSVLRFTGKPSDYTELFNKTGLLPGTWWVQTEFNSTDIKIYGRGTIDGNGYVSRIDNKFIADIVVPVDTTNFIFDGPLIRDSAFWALTPIQSTNVALKNVKILNRFDLGFEDDGIDVMESTDVRTYRAIAISKDDCFSTKTWPADDGTAKPYPHPPRPLENVVFSDCLAWTQCYGYKIGQGVYTDQSGVIFKDSSVYRGAVGLGIDHKFGSAAVRNVTFYNMDLEHISGEAAGKCTWLALFVEEVDSRGVGPVRDLKINQINVRSKGTKSAYIEGYNSSLTISDVTLQNIYMPGKTTPATSLAEMNILSVNNTANIVVK
jgi:polygalacturonase